MLDLLIKNAAVVDGTGADRVTRDIGIKDGRFRLDGIGNAEAEKTIDADGLALAPGFIDAHGHTDLFAWVEPLCSAKLRQGITTEIAGQCGMSPAPVSAEFQPVYRLYYESQGAPIYPDHTELASVAALMERLESLKLGINLAIFAAQGTLRIAAMGLNPAKPDKAQMDRMRAQAREAMQAGALGISSGLMYPPGSFSDEDELAALCGAIAPYGGIYTSHIRNQGNQLARSVEETLSIARRAGISANISHHKAAGKANWGKISETIRMIHEEGNATHDVYPYTASSTSLSATLPPACMKEGIEKLVIHLGDPSYLRELEKRIFQPYEEWDNDLLECGYDGILVIDAPLTADAPGLTIAQYAAKHAMRPFDAYIHLLRENRLRVNDVCFSMSQADVDRLIGDPLCMFGTDSLYVPGMKMTHPRSIGTFPRILGRSVREQKLITLEEAIRKMTSLPANRYGLSGKGIVAEGADADMVLFDPKTVMDRADYTSPLAGNAGIAGVYVGGMLAVDHGTPTGARNGHVLRKG